MKAVESVLHLERAEPAKMRNMIPDHVWALVAPYGLGAFSSQVESLGGSENATKKIRD
jgi:hypothetical protein